MLKKELLIFALIGMSVLEGRATDTPNWWTASGTTTIQGTASRVLTGSNLPMLRNDLPENNYAVLNLGQLKHAAVRAKIYLDLMLSGSILPGKTGGAGSTVNTMLSSAAFTSSTGGVNYAPANLGQLKAIAKPFYDRLQAVFGATAYPYPWNTSTPVSANYAIANIGQLKNVFNFDLSPKVYLAVRSDGQAGSGTSADPYDASGDKFDKVMYTRATPYTTIILAAGTYCTWGADDGAASHAGTGTNSRGFLIPRGVTIKGAGIGQTTIKMAGIDLTYAPSFQVLSTGINGQPSWQNPSDDVTVQDLTVDCNGAYLAAQQSIPQGNVNINGVGIGGNNSRIKNIEVLHTLAWGDHGNEGWAISSGAVYYNNCYSCLIDSCIVRAPVGNYVSGICLGGSGDLFTGSGVVRNCKVMDNPWLAYGGGGTDQTIFENNTAANCGVGFRFDTRSLTNVTIRNNAFYVSVYGIELRPQSRYPSQMGQNGNPDPTIALSDRPPYGNIVIEGNYLQSINGNNAVALGDSGWGQTEHIPQGVQGVSIFNNTFICTDYSVYVDPAASPNYHGIQLRDNIKSTNYSLGSSGGVVLTDSGVAPSMSGTFVSGSQNMTAGQSFQYTLAPQVDTGHSGIFSKLPAPTGLTSSLGTPYTFTSSASSTLNWTPVAGQVGTNLVAFSVVDKNNGRKAFKVVPVTVSP
jgi:hypothetical protein